MCVVLCRVVWCGAVWCVPLSCESVPCLHSVSVCGSVAVWMRERRRRKRREKDRGEAVDLQRKPNLPRENQVFLERQRISECFEFCLLLGLLVCAEWFVSLWCGLVHVGTTVPRREQ